MAGKIIEGSEGVNPSLSGFAGYASARVNQLRFRVNIIIETFILLYE